MFSLFAAILLLNAVLALPSPRPIQITDNSVSVSDTPSRRNPIGGLRGKLEADRARAQYLTQQAQQKGREKAQQKVAPVNLQARQSFVFSMPMTCDVDNCYVTVNIGTPSTPYTLIVDTGSSNTWVGSAKKFVSTSSTVHTGQNVSATYGTGSFAGFEVNDTLTLAPGIAITQSIGVATTSQGFNFVDGIIGLGRIELTDGSLSPSGDEIPTVMDNLKNQGVISNRVLGFFAPPPDASGTTGDGELTFGGTDSTEFTGEIGLTPTAPSIGFWAMEETISYGSTTLLLNGTGILDTGTSVLLMGSNIFEAYKTATGAILDPVTNHLQITQGQFAELQNLDFTISGVTYSLTPEAQILSPADDTAFNIDPNSIFLAAADLGTNSSQGINVIHGLGFLTRFYSVYDSDTNAVGLASAALPNSTAV